MIIYLSIQQLQFTHTNQLYQERSLDLKEFGMHILHWSLVLDLRLTKAGDMLFV